MITIEETEQLLTQPVLDQRDCLAIIDGPGDSNGALDAMDLLKLKLGPSIARRFKSIDRTLIKLLDDVREVFPDAEYYTASGGFSLLLGSSHGDDLRGQQQLSALTGKAQIGDGDY